MADTKSRPLKYGTIFWAKGRRKVVYEDMVTYFKTTLIQVVVSPLHDKDFYDAEDVLKQKKMVAAGFKPEVKAIIGKPKPPHWHVYVQFPGHKTLAQARAFFNMDNWGQESYFPYVEPLLTWGGSVRYSCHLNNPEKAQYDPKDVVALNGAKVDALLETSAQQKIETFRQLRDFAMSAHMYEYSDLVDMALDTGNDAMFQMLYDKPSFYDAYMRSVSRRMHDKLGKALRRGDVFDHDGVIVDPVDYALSKANFSEN